jgi:site-specific DNA recombinase
MVNNDTDPQKPETAPTHIAAYVRVSTEEQARSGLGIEAQKSRCKAMATVKEWPDPIFYADEGISGTKTTRPQLDRLLTDIEAGKIDAVIILSLDRLGRNTRLTLDLVARITKHVILVSCKEHFDTATPQGQFAIALFAALAQLERDLIGERTSAALQERSRRGGNVGRLPFGYMRTTEGVTVDPERARVVQRIFQRQRKQLPLRAIAAELNDQRIPSPHTGGTWHHSAVREILGHAEAYRGGYRGASTLRWPPLLRGSQTHRSKPS